MANQLSGQTGPSPRCYSRHQRTRKFARVRLGADQFSAFLAKQATRLSSTSAVIFAKLPKNTANRVTRAGSLGSLAS